MHTISIFVDQNRMPKLASYFECQTHLAKKLRNSANFIIRNLRTGLKKDPDKRTANENEVIETVRIGIEMANAIHNTSFIKIYFTLKALFHLVF